MEMTERLHDLGDTLSKARAAFEGGNFDLAYVGYCVVRDMTRGALKEAAILKIEVCKLRSE